MKEKNSNKYAFNLAEKKKVKILKGGELDFDNMNKGYYDELINKDDRIKFLKKSLEETKNWTVKESVYANLEVPQIWKNKLTYTNEVFNIISKDNNFFTYLTKVSTNTSDYNKVRRKELEKENVFQDKDKENSPLLEINKMQDNIPSPVEVNRSRTHFFTNSIIEEKEGDASFSKKRLSLTRKRTFGSIAKRDFMRVYSEREKREILDSYKDMFNYNRKPITVDDNNPGVTKDSFNAIKTQNLPNIHNYTFNSIQKNKMFKSSIYSLLLPDKHLNKTLNETFDGNKTLNTRSVNTFKSTNLKNNKKLSTSSETSYGPFLHFNYAEYNKKIEISNPEVKKVLEDIDYFGPYFSHCPSCRNKNLEFYQTMDSHNCLNILNHLKKTRKKNRFGVKEEVKVSQSTTN